MGMNCIKGIKCSDDASSENSDSIPTFYYSVNYGDIAVLPDHLDKEFLRELIKNQDGALLHTINGNELFNQIHVDAILQCMNDAIYKLSSNDTFFNNLKDVVLAQFERSPDSLTETGKIETLELFTRAVLCNQSKSILNNIDSILVRYIGGDSNIIEHFYKNLVSLFNSDELFNLFTSERQYKVPTHFVDENEFKRLVLTVGIVRHVDLFIDLYSYIPSHTLD